MGIFAFLNDNIDDIPVLVNTVNFVGIVLFLYQVKTSGPERKIRVMVIGRTTSSAPRKTSPSFSSASKTRVQPNVVPLHIAADTLQEIRDQLQLFAEEVIPLVQAG